ncbi:DUF5684 domain-containing protein [Microbacterium sp. AZCO]|uniref:DUF5684 domain-containing protein n=1 Tax=Microbacterium sp. AZCO TaxID=3142976 RepID=UPI0031F3597C
MTNLEMWNTVTLGTLSLVTFVLFYAWTAIALGAVFRKSGESAWKAWVPVLNIVVFLRVAGLSGWLVLLFLLPFAGFVVTVIASYRINVAFGHGAGMTVLAALLFPIWATVLGFGPDRWLGREEAARGPVRATYADVAPPPPLPDAVAAPSPSAGPFTPPPAYGRPAPATAGWTPPPPIPPTRAESGAPVAAGSAWPAPASSVPDAPSAPPRQASAASDAPSAPPAPAPVMSVPPSVRPAPATPSDWPAPAPSPAVRAAPIVAAPAAPTAERASTGRGPLSAVPSSPVPPPASMTEPIAVSAAPLAPDADEEDADEASFPPIARRSAPADAPSWDVPESDEPSWDFDFGPASATSEVTDAVSGAPAPVSAASRSARPVDGPVLPEDDSLVRPPVTRVPAAPAPAASREPWAPAASPVPGEGEAFPESSGPVSAIAGAPDAGMPRSALSSVSALHTQPHIPEEEELEATIVARRKRTAWTLTSPSGARVPLTAETVILGRRPSIDPEFPGAQLVSLDDDTRTVSKTHARLELRDDRWYITDLASTNGVLFTTLMGTEVAATPGEATEAGERFLLGDAEVSLSRSDG